MNPFPITERNRLHRLAKRGSYDRQTIYPIVDEALVCHVGFVQDGQPFVIPTIHARVDDTLILHGSKASRMLQHIQEGAPVCVTITLLDGLVLARSVFHSSMNYRSAVLFGRGRLLQSDEEKMYALEALTEHLARGRWQEARLPTRKELDATSVVVIDIEEASSKLRSGPPGDDEEDYALPIWAGVLPLQQQVQAPIDDPLLLPGIAAPDYVSNYTRAAQRV
jgi:hypothetical protein